MRLRPSRGSSSGITSYDSNTTTSAPPLTIRASLEDLRKGSAESRQQLREQLTGTFPETAQRRPSQESIGSPIMRRFSRRSSYLDNGGSLTAQSSTTTLDSAVKRLSVLPERDSQAIDLEKAISLLQELKKTATPEELVALHRALLPTKEVETVTSPHVSAFDERALPSPAYKRRSAMPPGLATRGGPAEDLLRRPGEEPQKRRDPRTKRLQHSVTSQSLPTTSLHKPSGSITSLAALDLADDGTNPVGSRATTPSEWNEPRFGAYRPGTLRITNGAASPEPAKHVATAAPAGDYPEGKQDDGYFTSSEGRPSQERSDANAGASSHRISGSCLTSSSEVLSGADRFKTKVMPTSRASIDIPPGGFFAFPDGGPNYEQSPVNITPTTPGRSNIDKIMIGRPSLEILPYRGSEDAVPIRNRILNSDKAQQQRKERAQRISSLATLSKESLVSQLSVSLAAPKISPMPSRLSFDRDRDSVSPVSESTTPRWVQRQSHRASQISAEYTSDCEISASPYEDTNQTALQQFAARLSTVYDSEGDDTDETHGTPADALAMLTGRGEEEQAAQEKEVVPFQEPGTTPFLMHQGVHSRPLPSRKADSGYDSDLALRRAQMRNSYERSTPLEPAVANMRTRLFITPPSQDQGETASLTDAKSLYTFEEILKSPDLLETTPSPSAKSKKSSPLLRLHTLKSEKRSSANAEGPDARPSSDSIPSNASGPLSPAAQQIVKQQKKLQKPMPPAVKKQRKEEYKKLKQSQAVELPAISVDVAEAHRQRLSDQPSSAHLERTFPDLGVIESQDAAPTELSAVLSTEIKFPSPLPSDSETTKKGRARSKSRGRGRSKSMHQTATTSEDESPDKSRSWLRFRSKSGSRARSASRKRTDGEGKSSKSLDIDRSRPGSVSPGEEGPPAWTDFSSVARTLGSGAYDISTNQFTRSTGSSPASAMHQLQSPYLISTGLNKVKMTKGMNSEAASELARLKSKDIAKQDMIPMYDRPRMAIPKKKRSGSDGARPLAKVEDRFPEWHGKPVEELPQSQRPQVTHRAHSMYAESIPPLPELPADVEVKASRADAMVAKKLQDSARATPAASARNSADERKLEPATREIVRTQTAPATTTSATSTPPAGPRAMALIHLAERAKVRQAEAINVQIRELANSNSDQSSLSGDEEQQPEQPLSPSHSAQHPGWPGWEAQAKIWQARRESLRASLGKPLDTESVITAESPPVSRKTSAAVLPSHGLAKSPSIVVSRYITPLATENAARANARSFLPSVAAREAQSPRGPIINDKENRPAKQDVPRTDSAVTTTSTSTFVTVKSWDPRPAKIETVSRPDTGNSGYSSSTYHSVTTTSTINRSRSPGGHVRTPSGRYIPYSPSQASLAERSRAASLAQLNGEAGNGSTPSLAGMSSTTLTSPSLATPATPYRSSMQGNSSVESLINRFSGGLQYGWDRNSGFAGSAGTRDSGGEVKRKSKVMSEQFGLDLSDVPVFLRRAS